MADRVISYDFRGKFNNLTAGLTTAGRSVDDFGRKLTAADKNGAKMRAGLTTIGNAAGKVGLAAAAGLGAMVIASARFDKAMSAVQAATHETAGNMELLRAAAIKAGADTVYSASEAASAIEELAKAGVSTSDILAGGLSGALNLAAAGAIEVGDAAELAATAMTQFKLGGDQVNHVADLLAAGAGKAQGGVGDLGMALKQSGLVAAQTGLTIEETTGTLAAFASAGLIGSDAGTSFKTMLQALTPSSKAAQRQLDALGISAYDSQGNFIGMTKFAGELRDSLSKLSPEAQNTALKVIFGSDAVRAASVIYQQGADGIQGWIDKTNDAGYAAETAATRMNNLAGDFEQFKGSLETALIGAGEGSQGPLRKLVQGATETVNALNAMPGPAKNAATGLLAITAVTGGGLWFGAKVINGITAARGALTALGITAETTRAKLALVGTGSIAAGLSIGTFIDTISQMDSISRSNAAADATAKSFQDLADALSYSNVGKNADDLHINLGRLTQDLMTNGAQGEYATQVMDQLAESSHGFSALLNAEASHAIPGWTGSAEKAYDAHKDLGAIIDNNKDILGTATAATSDATTATTLFGGAAKGVAIASAQEAKALEDAIKAMKAKRDAALAAFDAETAYRQALKDATTQATKNNAGIRGNSDAALANRASLSQLAAAWNNQSAAVQNTKGKFAEARAAFIQTAVSMGVPRKAAEDLAKKLLDIKPRSVKVTVETGSALAALNGIQNFNLRDKYLTVHTRNTGGSYTGSASGGTVPKTGLGYADRHPYMLADGEEVISNRYGQADRHRTLLKAINANRLAAGGTAGASSWANSRTSASAPVVVSPQSLAGIRIEGRIEMDENGAYLRGVIRDEIAAESRFQRVRTGG